MKSIFIASIGGKKKSFYRVGNDYRYLHDNSLHDDPPVFGFYSFGVLFDNSKFISISDSDLLYQENDMDLVIFENESASSDYPNIDIIRKLYPNAFVIGVPKEPYKILYNSQSYKHTKYNLENCDAIGIQYFMEYRKIYEKLLPDKKLHYLPTACNIEYISNNHIPVKNINKVFMYKSMRSDRRGQIDIFMNRMQGKYPNMQFICMQTQPGHRQFYKFLDIWKNCAIQFNLDPTGNYGIQNVISAGMETLVLGGNNESQYKLFPEYATLDLDFLEQEFDRLINNQSYLKSHIQYARNIFSKLYSYDAVRARIERIWRSS